MVPPNPCVSRLAYWSRNRHSNEADTEAQHNHTPHTSTHTPYRGMNTTIKGLQQSPHDQVHSHNLWTQLDAHRTIDRCARPIMFPNGNMPQGAQWWKHPAMEYLSTVVVLLSIQHVSTTPTYI